MDGAALSGIVLVLLAVGAANSSTIPVPIGTTSPVSTVMVTLPDSSNTTQYATVTGQTTLTYNDSFASVRIVSLEVNPASCTAYRFTVNATGGNPPYTISWFFGDNSTYSLSEENMTTVLHEYGAPGDYVMTVSIHDTPNPPLGPYFEDVKEIAVVVPASECGTQAYVAIALLVGVSAVVAFAAVTAVRRRRSTASGLTSTPD